MQPDGDTTAAGGGASPQRPSVLRSAAFMSLGTLVSRVLGLVRDLSLAALFPRVITDAYVVAFRLPNLFRRILGEGSLAASFVPLYVDHLEPRPGEFQEDALKKAQALASSVFSILALSTATLSVLGVVFMDAVMAFLVSGEAYQNIDGKTELTIHMGRIMFGFLFFVMTYAFLMSLLNAHKKFFLPALAPALLNLAIILSCFAPHYKLPGDQLAFGVLVGGALQLGMVVVPLLSMGLMPSFRLRVFHESVGVFFRKLIPSMLGMSVLQILAIINVNLASRLPEGTLSYIYLADRLLEFPSSLLSVSLSVALLPTLSALWAKSQVTELVDTVARHLRMLFVLSLPAALGLYLLAEPLIRLVFFRGEFGEHDLNQTAIVLRIYALVLIVSGTHRILVPAFYAMKNTWLPALLSSFSILVHYFVASWAVDSHGLEGLIWATTFTGFLNLSLLTVAFKLYFKSLRSFEILKSVLHQVPALASMGALCFYSSGVLTKTLGTFLGVLLLIASAVLVYFVTLKLTRHPAGIAVYKKLLRS